jgi:TolB protein
MAEPDLAVEIQPVQPPERSRRTRIGLAIALVIAIGAIGVILGARAINVIGRPPANALAYVDTQGGLHTIDDRIENDRVLPAGALTFQFPAWSPDGSRVAAIGSGPGGAGVFVFDALADDPKPVTAFQDQSHPPFYLYWTPDGRQLTFLTSERDGLALRLAAANGSGVTSTIRRGQPMYWALADRKRLIVHSGGVGDGAFLGETGLDGANTQPSGLPPGPFRAPALSATQQLRAYEVASGDTYRLVIDERDGRTRQEIPVPSIAAFEFSPVGSMLAYVAVPTPLNAAAVFPFGPLRLFDAVSGNDRLLLAGDVAGFFWSPDGKTIAVLRIPTEAERQSTAGIDRAIVAAAGSAPPPKQVPPAAPGALLRLVFKDVTGETRSERSVQVSELFANQVLPFFDQYALSHRFWSRDSRSITLPLVDLRPDPHITVIRADGSAPVELGPGAIAFWSP